MCSTSNPTRACGACDCAVSIEDIALALAQYSREPLNSDEARRRCLAIRDDLVHAGVYGYVEAGDRTEPTGSPTLPPRFRVAPTPVVLSPSDVAFFQHLGQDLLAFYRALNRLYQDSARGIQPTWVAAYLDQGKPESLVTYSRMNRFRNLIPGIIRPDIIPTADGMVITELDSVPGGIGLTGCLTRAYDNQIAPDSPTRDTPSERSPLIAGRDGMLQGFVAMVRAQQGDQEGCLAIVVSDEAKEYRPEMEWMAQRLRDIGCQAFCVEPRAIHFSEEGLFLQEPDGPRRIGLLYRFFELFDLKNIPKAELVMYAAKKGQVAVTPPYKPALEEKLAFALFHHPELAPFWDQTLATETCENLRRLLPRTWILDPQPVPPTATIPHLTIGGRALSDFRRLAQSTQKERQLVLKPSGFSELAWGSRGVSIGHDLPQVEWAAALEQALQAFPTTPYVLQEFHKGRLFESAYLDDRTDTVVPMSGRARLSPYYFVVGDKAELGGILATLCPANKKIIHGMVDAIMAPCAMGPSIPSKLT
ncbi:MAG: hypothetical protein HY348_07090 [Nitrospira defluvii]|nr:hypothetical protein [Nitrospira defluvii]